jgi:hypothetical protein
VSLRRSDKLESVHKTRTMKKARFEEAGFA